MTRRQALELLRQRGKLLLVRGRWCSRCRSRRREYREVLAVDDGLELARSGLATLVTEEGRQVLRPA